MVWRPYKIIPYFNKLKIVIIIKFYFILQDALVEIEVIAIIE